ncbi:MAG: UDP-3-O-(3-hydroxymyristoyl)glucosamine N-acyltransferase [Candidatus Omnitrophica bacterium]|nr:UDP-3-O-(3-hydroxymyristoyl)glucosamine N-acyltransferase [Candidatus Omnitrophota bacterium]
MLKTLGEIAQLVGGTVCGDEKAAIASLSGIQDAGPDDLTFLANPKYAPLAQVTRAGGIIVDQKTDIPRKNLIRVDNPSLAFSKIMTLFVAEDEYRVNGIHPSSVISTDAQLGKNVNVGPFAVIEPQAVVGDNTTIGAGSYIGFKACIGNNTFIYPHVTIREKILIGDRVIIHSGTVVGSDGFGYVTVNGKHQKIPQVGTVVVEDDVEIGANVTIDRARFDKTFIGRGTKIDNLVQIAHNVVIEENCIIVSQVGISGSSKIERNSILAGQVGIAGHLTIGANSIVAAQSGVSKSLPPQSVVFGYPARPMDEAKKLNAMLSRLAHYVEQIKELKFKVEQLENKK